MVAVPAARGVNVTEQLPLSSVQLVALNVPARPVAVKATEPAGVVAPAPLVSATVAGSDDGRLIVTEAGLQTGVVEVVGRVAVTVPFVYPLLELPACTEALVVSVTLMVECPT